MVRIIVNGREHRVAHGRTILDALRAAGIDVPHLCHDDRLAPAAVCRLCVVEVEGEARYVPACATPVAEGMAIRTHTPDLEARRRSILTLLAEKCPAVDGSTALARLMVQYGVHPEAKGPCSRTERDDSHPHYGFDRSRCIVCYRCVRICREVQGQCAWMVLNRGAATQIAPDSGTTIGESSCVSCGACVDTCPAGALEDHRARRLGPPTAWTRTVCPYCGVGCEVRVGTRGAEIVSIRPSPRSAVSHGHLCSKGRYAFEFLHADGRVVEPMLREHGRWRTVAWGEVIGYVADHLRRLVARQGPHSVGILASARGTNEENYLAQKFARVVLGTHNVDCCARVCHAPSAAALHAMLGAGAATNSYDDIERARTILICGANVTECHPVLGARIRQAALRGARLIVVDPRGIELTRHAELHLQVHPGTDVVLLNAIANVIVTEGLADRGFLRDRVVEDPDYFAHLAEWTPERAATICGVDAGAIRQAARIYACERPSMALHGLGVTESVQGTECVMCLVNLALLTGNIGRAGAGVNPLRGQNNVQGAAHMGCEPEHLTGYVPLEEGRARFERAWRTRLPTVPGLALPQMLDAAGAGRLRGLWVVGYDVLLTTNNARATRRSLEALDLLIVQDLFLNQTARELATVFLPAAASFEKDGTFMNAERRVQRVRRALPPPGEARADWEILCRVARAMGHADGFEFQSASAIWDEIRRVWSAGAGMSYARLEDEGLQWPCPTEEHPGTPILHVETFAHGRRARLARVEYRPSPERVSEEYPFLLITGRALHHYNSGTMTERTRNALLEPVDLLRVAPADALALGLAGGSEAEVASRYGSAVLPVRVDPSLRPGQVFATFHTADASLNDVTGPLRDAVTRTPEYKLTAVRVRSVRTPAERPRLLGR